MFSTSSIIDNLRQEESLEYKKLCRLLKISKKSDKDKLDIALKALEELEIINKNDENKYQNVEDSKHIVAKIRCSSKGYCFAVRDNGKEDIYIKENLLNCAWNGDKVLVRIIKESFRRRSPEGIVDCILERSNQILLAKVEIINDLAYAIPIDDRILSKIKLPQKDKKYKYNFENKNIVKVEIDIFPIGQEEGKGHVIKELTLNDEQQDIDFVLSKSNIYKNNISLENKLVEVKEKERVDMSDKNSYMFKNWKSKNSPILPIIHLDFNKDNTTNLWIHTNSISERLNLNSKKALDQFFHKFESYSLQDEWENYLSEKIIEASDFKLGKVNEAISLCINLNNDYEIINWSFHLTKVKCALVLENKQIEALLSRKSKTRITSRILKPIKEHIKDLDKILDISQGLRKNQLMKGRIEIASPTNNIESLNELFIHNPVDYTKEYFEPLNSEDIQTYLSPIFYEANLIWFKHSNNFKLSSASYVSQDLAYVNVSEIIKNSELLESEIQLNESGTLTFQEIVNLAAEVNKKTILHKLLINVLRDNAVKLITKNSELNHSEHHILTPWILPSYDFTNLINQYCIYNLITNGKRTNKSGKHININENNSWKFVNWDIFSPSVRKNMQLLFNNFVIDKINEYKNKVKQFRLNMISIKQVRKAEKLIDKVYDGLIISVQSYGFFVELSELRVDGLVHVSTLNNDWYEYRSKQNLLIGRKSKQSYKIGDKIKVKIIKVDILKYQIDLELS